jgi:hypothetical protein
MRVRLGVVACVLAVCALTLCAPLVVLSSTATPTPDVSSATPVAPAGSSSELQGDGEDAILRAQLELMRQYDERLLQTVYWALGTALTLVLFAAGAGWYVNFRLYERDKQALRSDLHSEVETQTASIGRDLKQDTEQTRSSLDETVKKMTVDLHEQADRRSKQIEKAAVEAGEAAVRSLQAEFKKMQIDIIKMRYEASIRDAENWRSKGVYANELREYMNAVSLATQLAEFASPYEFFREQALEGVQRALEAGPPLGARELAHMKELIDALPSKYSIQADRLRGLLSPSRG